MSALNLCMKPDRAIIMQDAACYDADGVILEFVDKGAEIPEMGCFVACTGAKIAPQLMARVLPQNFSDIDALANGEELLSFIYDRSADFLEERGSRGLVMIVAGWSKELGRPRAVAFARGDLGDGFTGDVGFMVHPQLEGAGRAAWLAHHGIAFNIDRFEPLSDGLRLLDIQRRQHCERGEDKPRAYLVGGFVTLTEIRQDGITSRVVHRWAEDRVGERIRPMPDLDPVAHPNAVPMAGMNRAARRRLAKTNGGRAA